MVTPTHVITKTYDDLKGFSTDNIYARPPQVADRALNIHKNTDESFGPRRGYQCEVADIGGLGFTSFDPVCRCGIEKICLHRDGNLYRELTRNIYIDYDLLSFISGWGTAPWSITPWSVNLVSISNRVWFEFTIFTDPRYLTTGPGWSLAPWSLSPWGSPGGESITFNAWLKNAAIVNGNQSNVNTITVDIGHIVTNGSIISLLNQLDDTIQYRTVISNTPTSITFSGPPLDVENDDRIDLFYEQLFRKGFDVAVPYPISQFIAYLNTIPGITAFADGVDTYPAAFIPIIEKTQLVNDARAILDYFYWEIIPHPVNPLLPGSANALNQNSPELENASFAIFNEVLYCTNGFDFPVKYDGQNAYKSGVPAGDKVDVLDNAAAGPFTAGDTYNYAITYEQKDKATHVVEGQISPAFPYIIPTTNHSNDVEINDITSTSRYNTNGALATGGAATVYGPDNQGFYYHYVNVSLGKTFIVGDVAYYRDTVIAQVINGTASSIRLEVSPGHGVVQGDTIYFVDAGSVLRQRTVVDIDDTGLNPILEIDGGRVDVTNNPAIYSYIEDNVYGHIAISSANTTNQTTFPVSPGHNLLVGDQIEFLNPQNIPVYRTLTGVTANDITFLHAASIGIGQLISSPTMSATQITIQAKKQNPIVTGAGEALSNNLRINVYRTTADGTELRLVAKIPNNSFAANQTFHDVLPDGELGVRYIIPLRTPGSPPMAKYIISFENLLIYAGGSRNSQDTDFSLDGFYFSEGDDPENVPAATNSALVPSNDDVVSGVGISGSTLVIFKDRSIYAISGELLTSQYQRVSVAPGSNIGCAANASIVSIGGLLYFLHTNGIYTMSESQLFPTDPLGRPIPISQPIDALFREKPYDVSRRFVFKRAVAMNYTQDNEYWLFLPCENVTGTIRNANTNSRVLCFDYENKNWFEWSQINAAGGFIQVNNTGYWQERRLSGFVGNTSNTYRQHNARRLVDYADHTTTIPVFWSSSWEDLGYPEVRKKFIRCMLLIDRIDSLYQLNQPALKFASYLNRYPNLKDTIADVTTVNNSTKWGSAWSWTKWSGLVDSFIRIPLRQGTQAKSMQISLELNQLNTSFKMSGFQLEISPEYDKTIVR